MAILKDLAEGTHVKIQGVIVRQSSGQTQLYTPGVGQSGVWSVVSSAEAEVVRGACVPTDLQAEAAHLVGRGKGRAK